MAAECGIAEAYVLRKLYKEKMIKEERERAKSLGIEEGDTRVKHEGRRGFFGMFKRIHPGPAKVVAGSSYVDDKPADSSPKF